MQTPEELERALRTQIEGYLNNYVGSGYYFRHEDADEMAMLADAGRGFFPERVVSMLQGASQSYPDHSKQQEKLLLRCLRMLDVDRAVAPVREKLLNRAESATDVSEELIPVFRLGIEEKSRVLDLCTQMRKIVFSSNAFDAPHRRRLLNRIAAIEHEVHQPKGMFDVVRGGLNDLGEALGKFGTDIKPLTDRMSEVVGIARKGTKEYDQLPAPDEVKSLPAPEDGSDS